MTEGEVRTNALGIFHYAHSYAASAQALSKADLKATHPDAPVRFLFRHAVELYLKSFLLLKGMGINELRIEFGHSTVRLSSKANGLGLRLSDDQLKLISVLEDSLADRYLVTGVRRVLSEDQMFEVARHLNNQIGPLVYEARDLKRLPPIL